MTVLVLVFLMLVLALTYPRAAAILMLAAVIGLVLVYPVALFFAYI